jgi:hypothetical protein
MHLQEGIYAFDRESRTFNPALSFVSNPSRTVPISRARAREPARTGKDEGGEHKRSDGKNGANNLDG